MNSEQIKNIEIRKLDKGDEIPYYLLLLADPSEKAINRYLSDSEIYIAELKSKIIGVYVLYPVNHTIIEIRNKKYCCRGNLPAEWNRKVNA
jgi:hypothetical protein